MSHPNIIKFFKSYEDEHHFHIVTEHCPYGELLTKMKDAPLTEF